MLIIQVISTWTKYARVLIVFYFDLTPVTLIIKLGAGKNMSYIKFYF